MTGGTVAMSSWRQFDKIEDKVGSRSEAWSDLLALPARPKLSSSSEDLFGRTLDPAVDAHTTVFGLASAPAQPRAPHPWRQNSLADADNGSSATRQQHQQQQPLYSPQLKPSARPDPFWPGPAPEISGPPVLDPAVNHETYRRAAVDFVLELAGPPQVVSPSGGVSKPIHPDSPRLVSADELPVPAFAVDRDTRCTVWNRRLAQLSGWEEAEVMKMADFAAELFAVDSSRGRSKACKELLRSAFFGRDALGVPFWLVTKAGNGCRRCVPVHLHAAQRTDAVGAASGVLCVVFPAAAPSAAAAGAATGGTTAAAGALQLGHGFAAPVLSDGAENSYSCLFGTTARGPSMDSTTSSSSISQCSRGGGSDAGLLFAAPPSSCCTFHPDSADNFGGGGGSSSGVRGADSGKHSRLSGHHPGSLGSSTPPFDYHERHMYLGLPRPPSTGALRTVGGGLVFPDLDPFRRRASFGLRYSADSLTSCDSVGSFGWQTSVSAASALNQDWPVGSPPPARCPPSPPPTPYLPSSAETGLSAAAASSLVVPAPVPSGPRSSPSGMVRALVMDSVDAVRNEMALSLERCGLDVVCAASLREAMWRFERALLGTTDDGPRFDVVFLELQQATGAEVYIAIRDLRRLEEEANLLQEPTLHPQHHHAQEQEQEQEGQLEEGEEEELSKENEDGRPLVEAADVEGSPDQPEAEAEREGETEGGEEAARGFSQSEAAAANEGCNLVNEETEAKADEVAEAEVEAEAEAEAEVEVEVEVEAGAEVEAEAEAGEEGGEDPPRCLILAMANMNRWDLAGLDVATAQCVRAGGDAVIPRNMPLQQLRVALRKLGIRSKYLMFPPRLPRALSGNLHNPLNLSR